MSPLFQDKLKNTPEGNSSTSYYSLQSSDLKSEVEAGMLNADRFYGHAQTTETQRRGLRFRKVVQKTAESETSGPGNPEI